MITVRLQIGDGQIQDTRAHGLVYLSADNRLAAPTKGFEAIVYPEEEGEEILPVTVDAPFDYKVTFFVDASGSLENANQKITAFNNLLFDKSGDDKTFKRVKFYNDYKKVLIEGVPSPIDLATDFWRDSHGDAADVVVVEWIIRVDKPSQCDFNLS